MSPNGFSDPLVAAAAARKRVANMTTPELDAHMAKMRDARAAKQAERDALLHRAIEELIERRRADAKNLRARAQRKGWPRRRLDRELAERRLTGPLISQDIAALMAKPSHPKKQVPLPSEEALEPYLAIVDAEEEGLTWNQRKRRAVRLLRADIAAREVRVMKDKRA